MKQNKGVIGVGLVLAIVLGVVVVGGGAYYLGKDSNKVEIKNPVNVIPNVEKQELPVKEEEKKETPPKVVSDCDSNSKPSIKVLSPKGGEVYKVGDKITVKWSSCNVQKVYVSMVQGGHDMGNLTETSILASQGSYQWIVPSTQWESNTGFIFGIWDADPGHTDIVGKSGSFSVAFATGMPDPKNISTTLPANYISSNNWPPVITTSSQSYSCNNVGVVPNTEGNNIISEKVINGKKYCITSNSDRAMSHTYTDYKYTTVKGNGTKIASFNLGLVSCGVYDKSEAEKCQATVSIFLNNLDLMIDSLMQAK